MNNWNTFINTNVLNTALLAQDDKGRRDATVDKTIRSIDFFLNDYPADGGCDEGPSYWAIAGGSLIQFLDLLSTFTNQRLDFSKNQLIHNIGSYIYKVHIDQNYYVNFADAGALSAQDPLKIYLFGKLFNDPQLLQFAAYSRHKNSGAVGYNLGDISLFLGGLSANAVLNSTTPKAPQVQQSWLPNLQVLALRQTAGTPKGLYFAAKGGNNNESHNHNDVGNFIVYKDGLPVVIDAGVGTYTRQTFGKDRYSLWFMQSGWHNCPTLNGADQQNGLRFKANDVSYKTTKTQQSLSMDIAAAYPAKAQVNSWQRTFNFIPAKGTLTLTEVYYLKQLIAPSGLNFWFMGPLPKNIKAA
ncbi:heparinase II/III domain-containing protein [Mucilaginibacter antarcticus]|uniref:heparinase II/III domain-containing protein n=1 Tax=Mucilaginibacter antarcticus TaxID=1855725 RepID=UPI003629E703